MFRRFSLVALLVGIGLQSISQTWSRSTAPYQRNINDAVVLSEDNLIINGGVQSNDSIWSIFTSTSVGLAWQITQDTLQGWSRSSSFYNDSHGIVVGDVGSIKRSTDGGQNWANIPSPTSHNLHDVFFVDSANGFAVGGIYDSEDTLQVALKSVDGGQSWSYLFNQIGSVLQSVYFINEDNGVAVGDNGTIMKTTNGGQNWNSIVPPVVRTFNTVEFINASTGFIVGGRFTNDSVRTVLKTTDGGDNWSVVIDEPGGWLKDINFIDQNVGYLVGDVATVLKSTNGGDNWSPIVLPDLSGTERFNTVKFLSEDFGLIAGNSGVVYILHDIPVPEVETLPAIVQPSETEILFQGLVNTLGHGAQYSFLFSQQPNSGYSEYIPTNITSNQPLLVERLGTFFTPATTYYYCVKAATIGGAAYGDTLSVVTTIPYATLSMDSVINQGTGMPEFYGTVSGFTEEAQLFFEYGTTAIGGTVVTSTPAVISDGATYIPEYSFLSPLPNGIHFVKLKAVTASGTYYSGTVQFLNGLPYDNLSMVSAEYEILTGVATIEGFVEGVVTESTFDFSYWSTGGGPGNNEPTIPNAVDDTLPHSLTATLSGLAPNTAYSVSLNMWNQYGYFVSESVVLYTGVEYSNFETRTATQITPSTAILNGYANDLNYDAGISFEYGETTQFGQTISATPAQISNNQEYDISAQLTDLTPNTLYYYRIKGDASGVQFNGQTRQFFTGPPEIPNWDFQHWEEKTVEIPLDWNILEEDFERVDLGGGNSALKLFGSNGAIMGYFTTDESEDGFPDFISVTPYSYQPDSVYVQLDYFLEVGDTAYMIVKMDSADVTVSYGFYPLAGNSAGNFTELGFEIEYMEPGTPDRVTFVLITIDPSIEEPYLPSPNNYLTVDRIHFGSSSPPLDRAELNNWANYTYSDLLGWSFFKFLDGVTGNLSDPPTVSPILHDLPDDTAAFIKNKFFNGDVIEGDMQPGDSPFDNFPFPIDRKHEVVTGYVQFDRQGSDSLLIEVYFKQEGEHIGLAINYFVESTAEMTPFEIPILYNTGIDSVLSPEPDSAEIRISIVNHDNISLSEVLIDKLCFDGFYVGHIDSVPDGITYEENLSSVVLYPNPTTGMVSISGAEIGAKFHVLDMNGSLITSRNVASKTLHVDLSHLSAGIYMVMVEGERSRMVKRLLVVPNEKKNQ